MKFHYPLLLFALFSLPLFGQEARVLVKGTASYVSSQNVYVKYASTEGIEKGDTLFSQKDSVLMPCLIVKDKSTTSCVCTSLLTEKIKVGDAFFARIPRKKETEKKEPARSKKEQNTASVILDTLTKATSEPLQIDQERRVFPEAEVWQQKIKGRLSASSYSNFYGDDVTHRMRYAFTLQGNNLGDSRFSTDNYITFRHTAGEWSEVQADFSQALKVYSLSVKYDWDKKSSVSLGRKINHRISSMGAIDGLQLEKGWGDFLVGGIAGSRPDYLDYGLNLNLFQAGFYVSHATNKDNKLQQSTLAFVEQRNGAKTDRRFVYFQHSNTLLKDLNFFGSFEMDLYQNVNEVATNHMDLTNLYLSLRYRFSKKLSMTASYDNRKNIIYYESYKSYIDQLIEDETRQGLRLNASYRLHKLVTFGANASWRFQKSDLNVSKNLNGYVNISRLPFIKTYASLTVNFLQTHYLDSKILGIRFTREIIAGKLSADVYARLVEYAYKNYEYQIKQKVAGLDIAWNLTRKLAFHVYYEGTFDPANDTFHRMNTKIIQRF